MKKLIVICLIAICLTVSAKAEIYQGKKEIGIFGQVFLHNIEDGDSSSLGYGAGAYWGKFLTEKWQYTISASGSGGDDADLWLLGINAKYHFTPKLYSTPYLGAEFSYAYVDNSGSESGVVLAPLAGMRFMMEGCYDVFVEYQYQIYTADADDIIDGSNRFMLGVSFEY